MSNHLLIVAHLPQRKITYLLAHTVHLGYHLPEHPHLGHPHPLPPRGFKSHTERRPPQRAKARSGRGRPLGS